MGAFQAGLQAYGLREWKEIGADLRSHIAEALEYGKPLDEVLKALGPADVLARAYAVELKMNEPADTRGKIIGRVLGVIGIIAASSFVSFIVVTALGSIAMVLVPSVLLVLLIGYVELWGVHIPGVQLAGLHPLIVMALGPIFMVVGLLAGWLLWLYVRALINMLRRALPRSWPSRQAG
jgi:uncharacterized membrane protein